VRVFAIFVVSALVVAVSGIAVILYAQSINDFDPELHIEFHGMGAMFGGFIVFVVEALIVAIVSVRRHRLTEWLAGFAGVVVGILPYWIMFGWLNTTGCGPTYVCLPDPGAGEILAGAAQSAVLLAVPVAAAIFLVVGLVSRLSGEPTTWAPASTGNQAPPGPPQGGGDHLW
jgi:hypothetical protein